MPSMDKYGRFWPTTNTTDLCTVCGQPRPDGECHHVNVADADPDAAVTLGGLSMLGLRVAVVTGGGSMVTYGTLKELTPDEVVVETRGLNPRRINRKSVDRVTGPYFDTR